MSSFTLRTMSSRNITIYWYFAESRDTERVKNGDSHTKNQNSMLGRVRCQYHTFWSSGDVRSQGTSRNGVHLVCTQILLDKGDKHIFVWKIFVHQAIILHGESITAALLNKIGPWWHPKLFLYIMFCAVKKRIYIHTHEKPMYLYICVRIYVINIHIIGSSMWLTHAKPNESIWYINTCAKTMNK